jgi:hypothetical protein
MRREVPKKPDVQSLLAKAGAGKKRKRSSAGILIALFLLAALLGLIYLLARPGTEPVPLMVVALDQLALPDEAISLRAQLVAQDGADEDINLEGFDLYFSDSLLVGPAGGPGERPLQEKARTGPGGEAAIEWRYSPGEQPRSFVVRYPGDKRRPASNDQGSVHVFAPDRPLLIVEARHGLLGAGDEQFRKTNVFDLSAVPGIAPSVLGTTSAGLGASSPGIGPLAALSALLAGKAEGPAEALRRAQAKKYQIVYLATAPGRPAQYRKLRGWLQRQLPPAERLFPDGPVLGRETYTEPQDEAAALRTAVRSLKGRFKGKLIGVVGRAGDARVFGEEGLTTFLVGDGVQLPAKVTQVLSWRELAKRLP